MMDGSIQHLPLMLDHVLEHAAIWHSRQQVVSAREDGIRIKLTAAIGKTLAVLPTWEQR
jgi:hypothetical protein